MNARPPLYGNLFFYADAGRLRAIVESAIEDASPPSLRGHSQGRIHALIVPHGTHLEVGPIAGYAYKLLLSAPQTWDRVTLLAPLLAPQVAPPTDARPTSSDALLLDPAGAYLTPFDAAPVDRVLVDQLRARGVDLREAPDAEPIIESQLPFLQTALGEVAILPLRVPATLNNDASTRLSQHAAELGLIVAAGNLTEGEEQATMQAISRMDIGTLDSAFDSARDSTRVGRGGLGGLFSLANSRAKPLTPTADLRTIALALTLARAQGASQVVPLFAAGPFATFAAVGP